MDESGAVLRALTQWGISFECHEHLPVHTIGECLEMNFIRPDVLICKNIFLCNRQRTQFYLMLIHPEKQFRTAQVSKELGVSRLSFGPDELLPELLSLLPGAVSPLGLLFDWEHRVELVCDRGIRASPRLAFHPCVNTKTVILDSGDFWDKALPRLGVEPRWVTA